MTLEAARSAHHASRGEGAGDRRPLLVGIGSRVCGDDAVGLHLTQRAASQHALDMALWEDRDALTIAASLLEIDGPVLLVDCADMGLAPGTWRAFGLGDAHLQQHLDTVSSHGFGLADALALTRQLGRDDATHIFAVQPFDVRPGQVRLTDGMSARLDELDAALWRAYEALCPGLGVTLELHGRVQGVGMRPTVARLARAAGLGGWVRNRAGCLRLRVEGPAARVRAFVAELPGRLPPHARVQRIVTVEDGPGPARGTFAILDSEAGDPPAVVVPADLAACPACLAEVRDPGDRRYGYPFTTCTGCGPRYSVVQRTPYDRERTTLAAFPLCPDCADEYGDAGDRRYHAQSIACPACGPSLAALARDGRQLEGDALRLARAALARGEVVAVRGLGGFQLVVDARQEAAIARLRHRKQRPHKPLAVMASSLEVAGRACELTPQARDALASAAAPIVLLDVLGAADDLPRAALSPDTDTLGVMLPTSPLHDLLLRPLAGDPTAAFDWLVVTSGNRRGEPLCLTTGQALQRLGAADLLLTHDRDIAWRCDDSVVRVGVSGVQVSRRARGFAPEPLPLRRRLQRCVLALGAGLKNAVALGFEDRVVLSPHVGDVDEPATLDACEELARALPRLLARAPEVVAVDRHPDLGSTRLGERLAGELGVPVVRVQHHHAHAAACMAEHGVDEALALVWDGVGLGDDGALWGGELLSVDPSGFRRLGSFLPAPLPGGDAAVRQPVRQLVGRLQAMGRDVPARLTVDAAAAEVWAQQCRQGLNAPASHAVGRLFDSVAALLGLAPEQVTWEGQAAVRLEAAARRWRGAAPRLPVPVAADRTGLLVADWRPLMGELLDRRAEHAVGAWALGFHEALARAAVDLVTRAVADVGPAPVALSGGVFQNRLLAERVADRLRAAGLTVLQHACVPPNDGGIALGQALIAGREG